jgi:CspA family cold shock protein
MLARCALKVTEGAPDARRRAGREPCSCRIFAILFPGNWILAVPAACVTAAGLHPRSRAPPFRIIHQNPACGADCSDASSSNPYRDETEERTMSKGTVKWFNATKGYGFIKPADGIQDVFVHISAVERAGLSTLNENQAVEYELVTGRNGKASAENLKVS